MGGHRRPGDEKQDDGRNTCSGYKARDRGPTVHFLGWIPLSATRQETGWTTRHGAAEVSVSRVRSRMLLASASRLPASLHAEVSESILASQAQWERPSGRAKLP